MVAPSETGFGKITVLIAATNVTQVTANFTDGGEQHSSIVRIILAPIVIGLVLFVIF
jgi:ribosomal protein S28E/S33